jgi:hypothetical protein
MQRAGVLSVLVVAACGGGTRFGKIVTEVSPSPTNPGLLLVRSCELLETPKTNIDGVALGDCKRYGVRRSPIVPVPVSDARVIARENRVITGFVEGPNGGATVTTCRIGKTNLKWALLDCAETAIATAPLDAPAMPAPPPAPAPPPPSPEAPPVTP